MSAISEYLAKHRLSSYEAYLGSARWKRFRGRLLGKEPFCACCMSTEGIQLHHVNYGNIGHEQAADFIPVCDGCHGKIHAALDERFPGSATEWAVTRTKKVIQQATGTSWQDARARWFSYVNANKLHPRKHKLLPAAGSNYTPSIKWRVGCRDCGKRFTRSRASMRRAAAERCTNCGGMLIKVSELEKENAPVPE
jgi:hypothetical protein